MLGRRSRREHSVATHKSAEKRARQALRRRARNRHTRSRVKTEVKKLRGALAAGEAEQAASLLRTAEGLLRRAASKGAIPKTRARRLISRLARQSQRLGG